MKELSIEQKAQRYDEILARAEGANLPYYKEDIMSKVKEFVDYLLPELKESEDEKIRKAILSGLKYLETEIGWDAIGDIDILDAYAWLEKQSQTFTKKDVDDAYLKGVTNTKNEIEKQYEANYQIRKDIATFIFNYRGDIKDRAKWMDYLGIKVSFVEKQGEQKPADKIEPKFHEGDKIHCKLDDRTFVIKEVDLENGVYRYTENGCGNDIDYADEMFELVEQKPAWSEEDERMYRGLHNLIYSTPYCDSRKELSDWLESIKERVQPKQEWSEDDERGRKQVVDLLEGWLSTFKETCYAEDCKCGIAWLKSLRPQSTWKPTEKQMETLEYYMHTLLSNEHKEVLFGLYNDLKQLKDV